MEYALRSICIYLLGSPKQVTFTSQTQPFIVVINSLHHGLRWVLSSMKQTEKRKKKRTVVGGGGRNQCGSPEKGGADTVCCGLPTIQSPRSLLEESWLRSGITVMRLCALKTVTFYPAVGMGLIYLLLVPSPWSGSKKGTWPNPANETRGKDNNETSGEGFLPHKNER